MSPILARVWPANLRRFARVPVFCATSRARFFVLAELHGEDMRVLGRCPMNDRPPMCLPLPGLIFEVGPTPGYVCPGCAGPGTAPWFECVECKESGDLLQSCPPGRCACGDRVCNPVGPCARLPVRGELVRPPITERIERPVPPGLAIRAQLGGGD